MSCLDSSALPTSTLSRVTTARRLTIEGSRSRRNRLTPSNAPVIERSNTSAATPRETPLTEKSLLKGMQKIIASIEKSKTALPKLTDDARKEYRRQFHRYLRDPKLDMPTDASTGRTKDLVNVRQGQNKDTMKHADWYILKILLMHR